MLRKKGQSTLEYVIVLTAIIAVVVIFAGYFLRERVKTGLEHTGNQMEGAVNRISLYNANATP